jgi:hypothetical protein
MKGNRLVMLIGVAMLVCSGAFPAPGAVAAVPAGYTCNGGDCGTLGADGVVTLSPYGSSEYIYISTAGGATGVGGVPTSITGTNGTLLTSPVFSANAGDALKFYFNYVTSDGSQFADFAWAGVQNTSTLDWTFLVTARTEPAGSIIPGLGMPSVDGTLTPASVPIIPGGPAWSPLGGSSGTCYGPGCGYTGWVLSEYDIPDAGSYQLAFGTMNWLDTAYQSGLAIDGATIAGKPIEGVPEPASMLLLGLGLVGMAALKRKFKS